MLIGVPKEIKDNEYRVGIVPSTVRELDDKGHQVLVETRAGTGAGLADGDYKAAGAEIAADADAVYGRAELIVKVKEPLAAERRNLRRGQVLFTYLHLAPDREQTEDVMKSGVTAIAYETVTAARRAALAHADVGGRRPHGAACRRALPGEGERRPRRVARRRAGRFAGERRHPRRRRRRNERGSDRLRHGRRCHGPRPQSRGAAPHRRAVRQSRRTLFSTRDVVELLCRRADLVIGTVLVPGATAPKLISAQTVKAMKPGAVIVDVAIDQGGCAETSRPTTHSHPTYIVDDVVHYCVTNMPGAVARTSTFALSNATTSFVLALADKGWRRALSEDPHLRDGLNVHDGRITYRAVAEALKLPYTHADHMLRV